MTEELFLNHTFSGPNGDGPSYTWGFVDNMRIAEGWGFDCVKDEPFDGIEEGLVARRPEAQLLNVWEHDPRLFRTSSFVQKVSVDHPLQCDLYQEIALDADVAYEVYFDIIPDIRDRHGKLSTGDWDAWAFIEVQSLDGQTGISGPAHAPAHGNLDFSGYNRLSLAFDVPVIGVYRVALRFFAKHQQCNALFVDLASLKALDGDPPLPPAPPPDDGDVEAAFIHYLQGIVENAQEVLQML